jgi:hypothetical protein
VICPVVTIPLSDGSFQHTCPYCGAGRISTRQFFFQVCTNSPDLRSAADKLGLPDPIPPGLAPLLAKWLVAGYPERENWQDVEYLVPCQYRSRDYGKEGICNAWGCKNSGPKVIRCEWLYRMATASCPKQLFSAH